MRIGYFDCFSGISGDMTLGALVDAGIDPKAIKSAIASLGLPCELSFETVRRCGMRATHAKVEAAPEHVHRHLHHIEAIIDQSSLTPRQNELAKRIFQRLGDAEAAVHGIEIKKVHFHEVGAVDSIVDIVGAAVGLDLLGVDRFESSPLPPGRGWVKAAHGKMPLPAPATAELLKGVPLASSDVEMEMTTPTGAAIVTTVGESFGPLPRHDHRRHRPRRGHPRFPRPGEHPQTLRRQGLHPPPTPIASGCSKPTSTTSPARSSATPPPSSSPPGRSTLISLRSR